MTDYKDRVFGWSTDIDWSKAPEWATHYLCFGGIGINEGRFYVNSTDRFMRADGSGYYVLHDDAYKQWIVCERPTAPQWNGEGLPPVGTLCEHDGSLSMRIPWSEVRILAHAQIRGIDVAVFQCGDTISYSSAGHFRPIKTPAQIAADEREAAIEAMWKIYWQPDAPTAKEALGLLWDAGLRFPKGEDQ